MKKLTVEDYKPYIIQSEDINEKDTQLLKVDTQTGYGAVVSTSGPYLTKEAAAEIVFTSWLSNHTLWDKIRTTGGAYGARVIVDNLEHRTIFSSYRDPTPEKSIQVYLDALKEMSENPISVEDIEKTGAKIIKVTLHVGAGTWMPVKTENLSEHKMHSEYYEMSEETQKR